MGCLGRPARSGVGIQAALSNDDGGFDRQIGIDDRAGASGWSAFTGTGALNSGVAPATNDWTFLAAVYEQDQYRMTFYVNGEPFTSSTKFGGSPQGFTIGRNQTFGTYYPGLIDNVFVYDGALSAQQIAVIQAVGFPSITSPAPAVPEPSTWAMMLLGFGAIGTTTRKRRRTALLQLA